MTDNIKGVSFSRPKRKQVELTYTSSREKRLNIFRNHNQDQFCYEGVAYPHQKEILGNDDDDAIDAQGRNYCHFDHTPDRGRVLIADMNFQPGDIIFREKPLLSASWEELSCFECGKPHPNESCRIFLGLFHNTPFIKGLSTLEDTLSSHEVIGDLDRARLFIKLLWFRKLCPDAPCWNELSLLTVSGTQTKACVDCINDIRRKTIVTQSKLITPNDKTEDLARLLAILNNNSHEIPEFGSGLWLYASLLEHSCQPNCNFVTTQNELILIALAHIPKGSSLTIDYNVHTYQPQAIRQQGTLSHYGFACTCAACTTGFDTPRAFFCPQSVRYHAHSIQHQPLSPQQSQKDTFSFGEDVSQLSQQYKLQQQQHFELTSTYSYDNLQISKTNSPFLQISPNTSQPSFLEKPCMNGLVHPIGDGINPSMQHNTKWKCSGCGYILSSEEVQQCLIAEGKVNAPPHDALTTGGNQDAQDLQTLFEQANYKLPSLGEVNAILQQGVVHFSHSKIYWILYALALIWTKRASDSCYSHELSHKKQTKGTKKPVKKLKKKSTKGKTTKKSVNQCTTANTNTNIVPTPSNTVNNNVDFSFLSEAVDDDGDDDDNNNNGFQSQPQQKHIDVSYDKDIFTKLPNIWSSSFFSYNYQNEQNTSLKVCDEMGMDSSLSQQLLDYVEYPLIAEHCWLLTIDALSHTLHLLHPELLILCDNLAQIQILKQQPQKAKLIWLYCYHISIIINSFFSNETSKLYQLVVNTPTSISALQLHYQQFESLMKKCQYQSDNDTIRILQQFANNALDFIDSTSQQAMSKLSSSLHTKHGLNNIRDNFNSNETDDNDDEDDTLNDNGRRRYDYSKLQSLHIQGDMARKPIKDDENDENQTKKRENKLSLKKKKLQKSTNSMVTEFADMEIYKQETTNTTFRDIPGDENDDDDNENNTLSSFTLSKSPGFNNSGSDDDQNEVDEDDDDDGSNINAIYNCAFTRNLIKTTTAQQNTKLAPQTDVSSGVTSTPNASGFGQFTVPEQKPVILGNQFGFNASVLFNNSGSSTSTAAANPFSMPFAAPSQAATFSGASFGTASFGGETPSQAPTNGLFNFGDKK